MSLYVIVTGYGKFMKITENPSKDLAKEVEKHFESAFGNTNIKLLKREELEVQGFVVNKWVENTAKLIEQKRKENPDNRFLVINIGVWDDPSHPPDTLKFEKNCWNSRQF